MCPPTRQINSHVDAKDRRRVIRGQDRVWVEPRDVLDKIQIPGQYRNMIILHVLVKRLKSEDDAIISDLPYVFSGKEEVGLCGGKSYFNPSRLN